MKARQIKITVTPEFEKKLKAYMKRKGIKQKSEAIRRVVSDAVGKTSPEKKAYDWDRLVGIGLKAPLNPNPRFTNEDDLWEKKG